MRDFDKQFDTAYENIFEKERATIENDIKNLIDKSHASASGQLDDKIKKIVDNIKQRIKPRLKEWYSKQTIPNETEMRNSVDNYAVGAMTDSIKCRS